MNHRWSDDTAYNIIGKILGYALAPMSFTGIGLPVYLRMPENAKRLIGFFYLALCLLIVLGNMYLVCRKRSLGHGASMFPVVFALSATPAYFLLTPSFGYWSVGMVLLIVVFDFFGQSILAEFVSKAFGLDKLDIDSQCF